MSGLGLRLVIYVGSLLSLGRDNPVHLGGRFPSN